MRFSTILTSEQASILYGLVKEHRVAMVQKWAWGIYDGLLLSLAQIDRGGGALLRNYPTPLDYGGDIIEAAIIPASTYIAWPGIKTIPGPFWDLAAMLPELSVEHHGKTMVWRPVTIYRATSPMAIVPLAAAVLPGQNPLSHIPAP